MSNRTQFVRDANYRVVLPPTKRCDNCIHMVRGNVALHPNCLKAKNKYNITIAGPNGICNWFERGL